VQSSTKSIDIREILILVSGDFAHADFIKTLHMSGLCVQSWLRMHV